MPVSRARRTAARAAMLAAAVVLYGKGRPSFVLPSHASSKVEAVRPVVARMPVAEPSTAASAGLLGAAAVASVSAAALVRRPANSGRRQSKVPCKFFFGGGDKKEVAGSSIYDFTVKDIDGGSVSLKKYEGKVCLIVNVASE